MNPLFRIGLKIVSSPIINMQKSYEWVRRFQSIVTRPPKESYNILDRSILAHEDGHEIPVRVFRPEEKKSDEVLLFFHGGGWVLGDIDTYTNDCIRMANHTGRMVLSVDYAKAPEHPFPAGFDDCYRAVEYLFENLQAVGIADPSEITLIGNSAGANLAAVVSQRLRDEGKPLPGKQVLINPVTYYTHQEDSPFNSLEEYGSDYGLTQKKMQEYMEMYVPDDAMRKNPYVSPILADDFSHQPDTLIISSEYDLLRDEGEAYGHELMAAGNSVRIFRAYGTIHNYLFGPMQGEVNEETYQILTDFLDQ